MIKKGLGKGLDAYFSSQPDDNNNSSESNVLEIDINKIEPNRSQPRKSFDEDQLSGLADSIREFGIIQPIIVRQENGYYSIVAGERRWRAARIAHLSTIPAIVREYTELESIEAALIENIQRADLNPIEESNTYRRLMDEYSLTQEDIAQKVGKSRSSVANSLRLLNLDSRVQNFLSEGKLSTGHARALLTIENGADQFDAAERVLEYCLSVRETEAMVKEMMEPIEVSPTSSEQQEHSANPKALVYKSIEHDLNAIFGTRVNIRNGKNKGRIEIEFFNDDDLDRLLMMIKTIG